MPDKPAAPAGPAPAVQQGAARGRKSFLFGGACLVEQRADTLTITLEPGALFLRGERLQEGAPTSTAEAIAPEEVIITCAGKAHLRHDSSEYPRHPRWRGGVQVVFRGGATFGRLLLDEGPVLLVQAAVRKVEGLPQGLSLEAWETIRFEVVQGGHEAHAARPDSGPHVPFP